MEARVRGHLRQYVAEREIDHAALAKLLSVNEGTVSRILNGTRGVGLGMALRIHRECDVSPWRLMKENAPEQYDDDHWTPPPRGRRKTRR